VKYASILKSSTVLVIFMNEDLHLLLRELARIRKRPLLVFNSVDIQPESVILTEKVLGSKKFQELDILVQTPGGDPHSAFKIVKLFRKNAKKVNIIVPLLAKSAGTLICLGADKIIMSEISELGPLDTQIAESRQGDVQFKSALNGFKALEQVQTHALENLDIATRVIYERSGLKMLEAIELAIEFSGKTSACLYNQLDPMNIGEYKRSLEISERYGHLILINLMGWSKEKAHSVAMSLIYDYPSHDSIIDMEELKRLGFDTVEIEENQKEVLDKIKIRLQKENGDFIHLVENNKRKNSKNVVQ